MPLHPLFSFMEHPGRPIFGYLLLSLYLDSSTSILDGPRFGAFPSERKLLGTSTSSSKVVELDADLAR